MSAPLQRKPAHKTPQFRYQNPDGNGSLTCGWTKQGQLFVRSDGAWGGGVVVARDQAWEMAKYIARDLPGGLAVALDEEAADLEQTLRNQEHEIETITAENVALVQQRDRMTQEIIELKAKLVPQVREPEPLTEEEVW